jgi:hypothetical protein
MVTDIAVAVHVVKKQIHEPFLANELALSRGDKVPDVSQNLVKGSKFTPESDNFLPQLVSSVMIQGLEPYVSRVLQKGFDPAEMWERVLLNVCIVGLRQSVYLVLSLLSHKIEILCAVEGTAAVRHSLMKLRYDLDHFVWRNSKRPFMSIKSHTRPQIGVHIQMLTNRVITEYSSFLDAINLPKFGYYRTLGPPGNVAVSK